MTQLQKMKRLATGMLVVAAEGAMVGALADWFAVTALFRHPLGLPIPHTAIVENRKEEIGVRLGDFIQKHFLRYRIVLAKLREHRPARRLLEWCATEAGANQCVDYLAQVATWALRTTEDRPVAEFLSRHLIVPLQKMPISPVLATVLELLTHEGHHRQLTDQVLESAPGLLDRLKPKLKAVIDKEIPWYAGFLRGMAYQKVVRQLQNALEEVRQDPQHPARLRAEEALAEFISKLREDPALQEKVQGYWTGVLGNPRVGDYAQHVAANLRELLLQQAADPNSTLRLAIRDWLRNAAGTIAGDNTLLSTLERNVERAALSLVRLYRGQIAHTISEEVGRWPTESASRLIEENIGADLQWIRINGTVVGGLAGLVIHVAGQLITQTSA